MLLKFTEIIIGFSSGIIIGSAFIALLTFLGIIPRLIQLSETNHLVRFYAFPLVTGTLMGTWMTFTSATYGFSAWLLVVWGLVQGVFNGMLAAALVEVLNVLPILSRRLGLGDYMRILLMAVVFGKIIGSLFQWFYFVD